MISIQSLKAGLDDTIDQPQVIAELVGEDSDAKAAQRKCFEARITAVEYTLKG